jgi:hypothetical protein
MKIFRILVGFVLAVPCCAGLGMSQLPPLFERDGPVPMRDSTVLKPLPEGPSDSSADFSIILPEFLAQLANGRIGKNFACDAKGYDLDLYRSRPSITSSVARHLAMILMPFSGLYQL